MKKTKYQCHEFTFTLIRHDEFPIEVEISRNGKQYCKYDNGTFLRSNSLDEFHEIPAGEKICLMHHIITNGNDIGKTKLSFYY